MMLALQHVIIALLVANFAITLAPPNLHMSRTLAKVEDLSAPTEVILPDNVRSTEKEEPTEPHIMEAMAELGTTTIMCADGFTEDGQACNDINECEEKTDMCNANASCQNTVGTYLCSCKLGFEGDGFSCRDINECENTNNCSSNASCDNTPGTYLCQCNEGFQGDGAVCFEDSNDPKLASESAAKGVNVAAVAGGIFGVIVAALIGGGATYYYIKKKRDGKLTPPETFSDQERILVFETLEELPESDESQYYLVVDG